MTQNRFSMPARASLLVLINLAGNSAFADDQLPLPTVFTFSAGYKINAPLPENIVELGVIKKCGGNEWCMSITRYHSAKMLPRVPTRYRHVMHTPYSKGTCSDGSIATVKGASSTGIKVRLQQSEEGFSIAVANFLYRWVVDTKAQNAYSLAEIRYKNDETLEQTVGFGFSSDEILRGSLIKSDLAYFYKGEIYHKTALAKVEGPWEYAPSSIDFRPYQEGHRGDILIRSIPGHALVVKKYGRPMWVQSSLVLARGAETIAPLVQEYGHDFNMDGCFNESGHNKLLLPVGKNNLTALVYVEYTPDNERGFPILSVGRYYR